MRKTIKKILMETIKDKKLLMAYVYFSNYMSILNEIVDDENGRIYLREDRNEYAKICIVKNRRECVVDWQFWIKFSRQFYLEENETQQILRKWIEVTYGLEGFYASWGYSNPSLWLKIPTN